jgi:hypothetical protein
MIMLSLKDYQGELSRLREIETQLLKFQGLIGRAEGTAIAITIALTERQRQQVSTAALPPSGERQAPRILESLVAQSLRATARARLPGYHELCLDRAS